MKKCDCYKEVDYFNPDILSSMFITRGVCNGTKERDLCTCKGDPAKCDFYPEKRKAAKKQEVTPTTIYYAHHQWKYGTKIEEYELDLIKRYFPHADIFNPAVDLDVDGRTEDDIMNDCFGKVIESDIIIFSSMDGVTGVGVYKEVIKAILHKKLVLYIFNDELHTHFTINPLIDGTDRIYASVELDDERRK